MNLNLNVTQGRNPMVGDVYADPNGIMYMYDGLKWCEVLPYREQDRLQLRVSSLQQENTDLMDYLKYKNIDLSDLKDFINGKRMAEKLSE
jgi:hypothetical protein